MNTRKYLLASLAAFVVVAALDTFINGVMLAPMYKETASVWRPEAEMMQRMWMFFVSYAVLALVFTQIYIKGIEKKKPALGQGVRYGLTIGVLIATLGSFVWYVVLPIPLALAFWWFVVAMVESVIAGVVVATVYGSK